MYCSLPAHQYSPFVLPVSNFVDVQARDKGLTIYYLNSRSLCNKMKELELLLKSEIYDFILICETWLNSNISDAELLTGSVYNIIRCDRTQKSGGGVAVFYKNIYKIKSIPYPENFKTVELLAFDLCMKNQRFRFILSYRPPNLNNEENNLWLQTIQYVLKQIASPS